MAKLLCLLCAADPLDHSFYKINSVNPKITLFYSCPAESSRYFEREGVINHFDIELTNNQYRPWAWMIDCKGFSWKHATEIKSILSLADLIKEKYANELKKIWIINSNIVIKVVFNMLLPFIPNNIKNVIEISDKTVEEIQTIIYL